MSQGLSLHPVHLTPDEEGKLPPSALVPFCSYQGDDDLLGQERPELDNLIICDKFKPTILEGQLCYSLDIVKLGEKGTKSGKNNGLFSNTLTVLHIGTWILWYEHFKENDWNR